MKRFVSKMIIAAALVLIASSSVFAASAKVTYVKGKVEVNRGKEWVSLKVGDVVNEAETISTGFQSEARLNFNGSVMAVPALSRITLETLQSSGTKETVSLKVDTGAVRSRVTHTEGKRIEYSARTSVAVASVRGTDFAVFSNGKAKVFSGAIAYYKAAAFIAPVPAKNSGSDEGSESDEGPASATTAAGDIADSAPRGTVVVGAGQSSSMGKSGLASKPLVEAKKRSTKAKAAVASAATKEVLSASLASAAAAISADLDSIEEVVIRPEKKTTASVEVTVSVKKE
jgi:hypothetical protein